MPTAIVTGASRGLGLELTRALLREGRRVVIDARGARELGIAEKTDKTHVGHVLAKLGVPDRTSAALHAVRAGLVPDGPGA